MLWDGGMTAGRRGRGVYVSYQPVVPDRDPGPLAHPFHQLTSRDAGGRGGARARLQGAGGRGWGGRLVDVTPPTVAHIVAPDCPRGRRGRRGGRWSDRMGVEEPRLHAQHALFQAVGAVLGVLTRDAGGAVDSLIPSVVWCELRVRPAPRHGVGPPKGMQLGAGEAHVVTCLPTPGGRGEASVSPGHGLPEGCRCATAGAVHCRKGGAAAAHLAGAEEGQE